MNEVSIPCGFLALSNAVNRLASAVFGGLRAPVSLGPVKQVSGARLSLGFGPWRDHAAGRLRDAALKGELSIYVTADLRRRLTPYCCRGKVEPVRLPKKVLERLVMSRAGLSDHPIRPSLKTTDQDEKLLALLRAGILVVCEFEFKAWLQSERAKGKWSSQRSRLKPRVGRPSKQTAALSQEVLKVVRSGEWNGKEPIRALVRELEPVGYGGISEDTLIRLVRQLYLETGEPKLLRTPRPRRNRRKKKAPPLRKIAEERPRSKENISAEKYI
jgi:hypothetical protein